MSGATLICAIIGHLVGDYLLQNDWMALNKKKPSPWGNTACVVHCALWTFAVILFSEWYRSKNLQWICWALFLTHYAQDRTNVIAWWMRLRWKDQSKFMENDRLFLGSHECDASIIPGLGPWSVIVVDNVWHIVTIWAIWRYIA